MLNVYNYKDLTTLNYTTAGHTVRNINAKINVNLSNAYTTTTGSTNNSLMISFDNGKNWLVYTTVNIVGASTPNYTNISLYMLPGITNISLSTPTTPAGSSGLLQVIEYYEPGTQ